MSGEFERIHWIRDLLAGNEQKNFLGPGDDAASWAPPPGHTTVLSVDTQLEDIHFRRHWLSLEAIGQRAVSAAASDLAAMAAEPAGVLLSLSLPDDLTESEFKRLFKAFVKQARIYGLEIFGGNLSKGPLGLTTTVIGHALSNKLVYRSGAQDGDSIFVTGHAGRSRLGRALLERVPLERGSPVNGQEVTKCIEAFRDPVARIPEALQISRSISLNSMIDTSDGVAPDLCRILEESFPGKAPKEHSTSGGAVLDSSALAFLLEGKGATEPFSSLCQDMGLDPLETVLEGGEDFELLFITGVENSEKVKKCSDDLKLPITKIGNIDSSVNGLNIVDAQGKRQTWEERGFDHFMG